MTESTGVPARLVSAQRTRGVACCCCASRRSPRAPPCARTTPQAPAEVALADLPKEARDVYALVGRGGPFQYDRDGIAFGNREKLLPADAARLLPRVHRAHARREEPRRAGA